MPSIPATMSGLVLEGYGKPVLKTDLPVPSAGPGSVLVKVLHCLIHSNSKAVIWGGEHMPPTDYPSVTGSYGVGRIAAVGPDTTAFQPGQLVVMECFVRARDDPDVAILWGTLNGFTKKPQEFGRAAWRDGMWADYVKAPLENVWAINEEKFLSLGSKIQDLSHLSALGVVYGGLRKIDLKAGETVVISPATGFFTGGAVAIARAMGVNVIAASRNEEGLKSLQASHPGVKTLVLKDDDPEATTAALEGMGTIDAFVDISPFQATGSPHLGPLMNSVRRNGRICLMGGRSDPALPVMYLNMILKDLTIRGSWMFEEEHFRDLVKLVECGQLRLDKKGGMEVLHDYPLKEWKEAVARADDTAAGKIYIMSP